MNEVIKLANTWRMKNSYSGKGGVVVIFDNEVQGWVNMLRNPEHWQPGCLAVTEDGYIYEAVDGNEHDGAKRWLVKDSAS